MKAYSFSLILSSDVSDQQVELLYDKYGGDVLSGMTSGEPYLDCTITAESFEQALRLVMQEIRREGLNAERVEAGTETLALIEVA